MMRRLAALVLAGSLAALASLAPPPLAPAVPTCAAAGPHHVALVVEHGNGSAVKRCVAFTTASISGQQLLANSGVSWSGETFGGFGEAVCALDGEPAQYAACPGKDAYWAVFVARSGAAWQLANVGISSLALHDGDAEGFRYVPASGTPAAPPSPAGVCAAAQNPAPTPRATAPAPARASGTAAAATSTAASAASGPEVPPSPGSSASPLEVAAVAGSSESSNPSAPGQPSVPPSSPSGPDLGLLAAALAGGGLAGLAILRLLAGRRPGP